MMVVLQHLNVDFESKHSTTKCPIIPHSYSQRHIIHNYHNTQRRKLLPELFLYKKQKTQIKRNYNFRILTYLFLYSFYLYPSPIHPLHNLNFPLNNYRNFLRWQIWNGIIGLWGLYVVLFSKNNDYHSYFNIYQFYHLYLVIIPNSFSNWYVKTIGISIHQLPKRSSPNHAYPEKLLSYKSGF